MSWRSKWFLCISIVLDLWRGDSQSPFSSSSIKHTWKPVLIKHFHWEERCYISRLKIYRKGDELVEIKVVSLHQHRPRSLTRRFSISILFFINKAYLETSSWSPAFTESLQLRADFSNLPSYRSAIGTKLPFWLHSQPWAALNAPPSEAESVNQIQRLFIVSNWDGSLWTIKSA